MSLQGVFESIVLKFISPYVEGLNLRSLQTGIWIGRIDVENIKVKPDVLALFGLEGFRIVGGEIGAARVRVPWHALYSGRISVQIENVNLHVEHIGDSRSDRQLVRDIREAKGSALEVRVGQLRDLDRQREAMAAAQEVDTGMAMRIAQKFINNLTVRILAVSASFASSSLGIKLCAGLPELSVLSTGDPQQDDSDHAVATADGAAEGGEGAAIYKVIQVRGLCARLGVGSAGTPEDAPYVMTPTLTTVKFAHDPESQTVKLWVYLGTNMVNQYKVTKSQLTGLIKAGIEMEEQQRVLRARLVLPEVEKEILSEEWNRLLEYGKLYKHKLVAHRKGRWFSGADADRLQLLEDVLAVEGLAVKRLAAEEEVDAELPQARPFYMRVLDAAMQPFRFACSEPEPVVKQLDLETQDPLSDLKQAVEVDRIDVPQKFDVAVKIGELTLDLVDDTATDLSQLLHVAIKQTDVSLAAEVGIDHKGKDSVAFRVSAELGAVGAQHSGRTAMRISSAKGGGGADENRSTSIATLDDVDATPTSKSTTTAGVLRGGKLTLENKLEETCNLLSVGFELAPHDIHVRPSLIKGMLEFLDTVINPPEPSGAAASPSQSPSARGSSPAAASATPRQRDAAMSSILSSALTEIRAAGEEAGASETVVAEQASCVSSLPNDVMSRLPDRISLSVKIASPTIHTPVHGVGTAVLCLGCFSLSTPAPCEVEKLDLAIDIVDTSLWIRTPRGGAYDVLKPLTLSATVNQCSTEEELRLSAATCLGKLELAVAPQSLQTVMSIVDSFVRALPAPPLDSDDVSPSALVADARTPSAMASSPISGLMPLSVATSGGAKALSLQRQEAEQQEQQQIQSKIPQRLVVDVAAQLDGLVLKVADAVSEVFDVRLTVPAPGVEVHCEGLASGEDLKTMLHLAELCLSGSTRNCRSGAWEPLIEDFRLGIEIETGPASAFQATPAHDGASEGTGSGKAGSPTSGRSASGASVGQSSASGSGGVATHVVCTGQGPLLLNVCPSTIKRIVDIAPLYAASASNLPAEDPHASEDDDARARNGYSVINLTEEVFEVSLTHADVQKGSVQVAPTGSDSIAVDELVVEHSADGLRVASIPDGSSSGAPAANLSEALRLAQPGAVQIPNTAAIAELVVTPEGDRHLVLSTALQLHNQTDASLHIRFHGPGGEALPRPLPDCLVCGAGVLGRHLPQALAFSGVADKSAQPEALDANALCLPPNGLCAVPSTALQLDGGAPGALVSVRLAGFGLGFSAPFRLAGVAGVPAAGLLVCPDSSSPPEVAGPTVTADQRMHVRNPMRTLGCFTNARRAGEPEPVGAAAAGAKGAFLRYKVDTRTISLPNPASPMAVTSLALQPAMTFLNALPFGSLCLRYQCRGLGDWREVRVPKLMALCTYDVPPCDVDIAVRLEDEAPWSSPAKFREAELGRSAGKQHKVELRQRQHGAPAGAVVETADEFQLRVSCPTWLVDRSGLPEQVLVRRGGAPLPSADGITLLPSDCFEKSCELREGEGSPASPVDGGASASSVTAAAGATTLGLRMPPDFSKFAWKLPSGSHVFCAQLDAVAASGLFGAQSRAVTLRPQTIVTNDSAVDIELRLLTTQEAEHGGVLSSVSSALSAGASASGAVLGFGRRVAQRAVRRGGGTLASNAQGAERSTAILAAGVTLRIIAGASEALHVEASEEASSKAAICFRPVPASASSGGGLASAEGAWSGPVPCNEHAAGSHAFLRSPEQDAATHRVWTAAIAPLRGSLAISFRPGSVFVAVNRVRSERQVAVRPGAAAGHGAAKSAGEIALPFGREAPLGWAHPFAKGSGAVEVLVDSKAVMIKDVRRSMRRVERINDDLSVAISIARVGAKTVLTVEDAQEGAAGCGSSDGSSLQVELKLSRLGVSLIQEAPVPRELLFFALDFIRVDYKQCTDVDAEELRLLVSDVQLACQLPDRIESGLEALGIADRRHNRVSAHEILGVEKRAVILAEGSKSKGGHFIDLLMQREATSSQDMILGKVELAINRIELLVDDGWLDPVLRAVEAMGLDEAIGTSVTQVVESAGSPFISGYTAPDMPPVVQIESLHISAIHLKVSCSVPFRALDFLPSYVKGALCVICLGDRFDLHGASISLPEKTLPAVRGSAEDVGAGLGSEYMLAALGNVAGLLGKSSLLNLPAAPFKLGGAGVSMVCGGIGSATGEAAARLGKLTLGSNFAAKRRQDAKSINHAGDGLFQAGKSLFQGIGGGAVDIVCKPAEGARTGGVLGFARGLGQGVASCIVKPIVGVGGAASDISTGVAATLGGGQRRRNKENQRWRPPRMLYGPLGAVREYSELDAELLRQLGPELAEGVDEVIPLSKELGRSSALLLFRYKMVVAEAVVPDAVPEGQKATTASESFFAKKLSRTFKPVQGHRAAQELPMQSVSGAKLEESPSGVALKVQEPSGSHHFIPLDTATLGDDGRQALLAALSAAATAAPGATACGADWSKLRKARLGERGAQVSEVSGVDASGKYVLQVMEVQRKKSGHWVAPFMHTDRGLRWRWVDTRGSKHPSLPKAISLEQSASLERPPCELDRRFRPAGDWEVQRGEGMDAEGWVYGLGWASSRWTSSPGMASNLRKRLWVRRFS